MRDELVSIYKSVGTRWLVRRIESNSDIKEWLDSEYPGRPTNEQIYLCVNSLTVPKCIAEGCQHVPYFYSFKRGYAKACSHSCQNAAALMDGRFSEYVKKAKKTCLGKYGVENAMRVPEKLENMLQQKIIKYGRKEGLINTPEIAKRAHEASRSIEAKQKRKKTLQQKYGVDCPFNQKEKVKQTLLDRYGVETPLAIPELVERRKTVKLKKLQSMCDTITVADIEEIEFDPIYPHSQPNISFICKICGENNTVNLMTFQHNCFHYNTPCKTCLGPKTNRSRREIILSDYVKSLGVEVINNNRSIIPPYDIDIFVPEANLGIEFCGLYWHSENHTSRMTKEYHARKWKMMDELGYRLITIFEDEFLFKRPIVERLIKTAVGKAERGVGARNLRVSDITAQQASSFLESNHLQGASRGNAVGAFHNEQLVAVMQFGLNRDNKTIALVRYATNDLLYPGIASKLFKFYVDTQKLDIVTTFADLRWSNGNLYKKLGFLEDGIVEPDYYYTKGEKREHKSLYRKDAIAKKFGVCVENQTEKELMTSLGYRRIWDCGKIRFRWHR